jgi:tRNA threonylcarbamoyladenosine biosynthesis protein TsaB
MIILALEFSTAQRSVALARHGEVLASAVETGGFRVTNAFSLITQVLAQSNIARDQVGIIAVGLGPGSYTGIRSAIAVAQGWQLARPVKLLGISSVEAIVARAAAGKNSGPVNVVVDAQRNEFYLSTWQLAAGTHTEISPLRIISAAELAERVQAGESCIGPEQDPASGEQIFPDAATLAVLASRRTDFISGQDLEPIYLRETTFVKAPPSRVVSAETAARVSMVKDFKKGKE